MLKFENAYSFILLFAIVLLIWLFRIVVKWKKTTIKQIGDERLIAQLLRGYSAKRFQAKFILIAAALILCVLGLANLQFPQKQEVINRKGIDVMVALDVSKSMLATDIQPNRLERAKLAVSELIDKLQGNKIGLVLFAGRAYLQTPLTTDQASVKMYLNTASTASVPTQGTVIGEALQLCSNAFETKQKKYKAVVVLTDGEDHDQSAFDIAKKMKETGIVIHTIGVGSAEGGQIIDPETNQLKLDKDGMPVLSKLNENELKALAETGSGTYQLLNDADVAANNILKEINSMEKKSIEDYSQLSFQSLFQWFLFAAIILLIAELLIPERKIVNQ
jgi:Ca-activated chloride channel family protein